MKEILNFLDVFAGAGGLSEGFIQAGFKPIAHIEHDRAACFTLKTRMAYHWLKKNNKIDLYNSYLNQEITRQKLYSSVPLKIIESVIPLSIGEKNEEIFYQIDQILDDQRIDVLIGGPPCQAYSLVGRSRDKNRMLGDSRNYLYKYYAEFLDKYSPRYFLFENVIGLLSANDKDGSKYFDNMRNLFAEYGYKISYEVLNSRHYGIPQNRKRVILFGSRNINNNTFPKPEEQKINYTIFDLFDDLPKINAGQGSISPCKYRKQINKNVEILNLRNTSDILTWHISRPNIKRDLKIYKIAVDIWNRKQKRLKYIDLPANLKTHNNLKSFHDRFKVVVGENNFSHTVVAHISKDGHYYIHPDIQQNRSITPREAARLQTFPDNYYFEGVTEKPSRTQCFKQIGNAVPVLLSRKIGEKLREY